MKTIENDGERYNYWIFRTLNSRISHNFDCTVLCSTQHPPYHFHVYHSPAHYLTTRRKTLEVRTSNSTKYFFLARRPILIFFEFFWRQTFDFLNGPRERARTGLAPSEQLARSLLDDLQRSQHWWLIVGGKKRFKREDIWHNYNVRLTL